eukprot:m.570786 g.570786  ORF g.570786 m.570786 type:complete len:350 (+) comp22264_c0_seq3:698-1747(+)
MYRRLAINFSPAQICSTIFNCSRREILKLRSLHVCTTSRRSPYCINSITQSHGRCWTHTPIKETRPSVFRSSMTSASCTKSSLSSSDAASRTVFTATLVSLRYLARYTCPNWPAPMTLPGWMSARCSWHLNSLPGTASRSLDTARNGFLFLFSFSSLSFSPTILNDAPTAFVIRSATAGTQSYTCTSRRFNRASSEMNPKTFFLSPIVVMKDTCWMKTELVTSPVSPSIDRMPSSEMMRMMLSAVRFCLSASLSPASTVSFPRLSLDGTEPMCFTSNTPMAPLVPLLGGIKPSALSSSRGAVFSNSSTAGMSDPRKHQWQTFESRCVRDCQQWHVTHDTIRHRTSPIMI